MSHMRPGIVRELESWNSPFLEPTRQHHTKLSYESDDEGYGNSDAEAYLQTIFYSMHLAPHLTCKRLVRIKYLHKKNSVVVDEKPRQIRDIRLALQTADDSNDFESETHR